VSSLGRFYEAQTASISCISLEPRMGASWEWAKRGNRTTAKNESIEPKNTHLPVQREGRHGSRGRNGAESSDDGAHDQRSEQVSSAVLWECTECDSCRIFADVELAEPTLVLGTCPSKQSKHIQIARITSCKGLDLFDQVCSVFGVCFLADEAFAFAFAVSSGKPAAFLPFRLGSRAAKAQWTGFLTAAACQPPKQPIWQSLLGSCGLLGRLQGATVWCCESLTVLATGCKLPGLRLSRQQCPMTVLSWLLLGDRAMWTAFG
jgi:hypothetical protein